MPDPKNDLPSISTAACIMIICSPIVMLWLALYLIRHWPLGH